MMRLRVTKSACTCGIGDEVHISLPVARLDVGQAMPLFRKGAQRFAEKGQLMYFDREFVGLGPEESPARRRSSRPDPSLRRPYRTGHPGCLS